ncbi:hypothetical protein JYT36_00940, partial [Bacteroidales bacterium AH-315-N07]|nr:hypothetical protein [Bacteroidales bacterium AH-315-N07]
MCIGSSTTTWDCACIPGTTEDAVIDNGHTVTLTGNVTIKDLTINLSATLVDNNKTMDVTGNLLVNGTYDAKKNLTLSGTGTSINGTGTKANKGHIIISGDNQTILATANLNVAQGNFKINAGLTVTNYGTITMADQVIGLNAASTWINESGATLNAANAVLATGILIASAVNNTVNYNRAGGQAVKDPSSSTYYNLHIKGNNIKTLGTNIIVLGDLTITSTLDVSGNNYSLNIGGNWNNSGTFDDHAGTVTFDGSGAQSIINTTGETFNNLTFNKSSGTLTLNNDVTVSNTLTMTQGSIDATSGKLTLGTSTANEGTLTYSAGSIKGKFERWINTLSVGFLFPVGPASDYNPGLVTFSALGTSGSLIGEFIGSDPGKNGIPLFDATDSIRNTFVDGYWTMSAANSLASSNYDLELTGNSFTSFTINASTRLLTRANATSDWTANGTHVSAVGNTTKRSALSTLSAQYAFGDTTPCVGPTTSAISTANDSVCISATGKNYSVTNTVGSTYSWTITGGTIASGQGLNSITVDWGSTGMVGNVQVVENNGCTNGVPVNLSVNIHTLPTSTISGRTSVMENATAEPYSVTKRDGYTYTWVITGGTLATGQGTESITVNWGASGTGNVRATASSDCGSADPVDLTVNILTTLKSIISGNWSNTTTWDCGCIPSSVDNVQIESGDTVTLTAKNTTINNFKVNTGGVLDDNTENLIITGDLTVDGEYTGSGKMELKGTAAI